ncbi:MAG: hypothetical protein ACFB20_08750 [Opitutales bacterium]
MATAAITHAQEASTPSTETQDPTLALFERYVEALGGEKALMAKKTRVMEGRAEFAAAGLTVPFRVFQKAPDRMRMEMEMPGGLGKTVQVVNGDTGWANDSIQGFRELDESDLRMLSRDADFYFDAHLAQTFPRRELLAPQEMGGILTEVVEAHTADGQKYVLYFGRASHLLVRMDLEVDLGVQGRLQTKNIFSDYREVDGIKVPYKITSQIAMGEMIITVRTIEHDVPVDDALFVAPQG